MRTPFRDLFFWYDFSDFFTTMLPGQRLLDSFLLARFQIEGMFLHFFDDVFLLNLSLKTSKRILDRFTVLYADFGQLSTPPIPRKPTDIIHEPPKQCQTVCYTSRPMARCPLCSERPAKRFCPAKETRICSKCCGSRREVDIDCPGSCHHLMAGRVYESDRRTPDPQLESAVQKFDKTFTYRHTPVLNAVCLAICEERAETPWLLDTDVIEVLKDLTRTMKTLSSGIYYESLPASGVQVSLFHRLKRLFDGFMQPQPQSLEQSLKLSDVIDVLTFLTYVATVNSNSRPRSRQYLDLLTDMAKQTVLAGNLIAP